MTAPAHRVLTLARGMLDEGEAIAAAIDADADAPGGYERPVRVPVTAAPSDRRAMIASLGGDIGD